MIFFWRGWGGLAVGIPVLATGALLALGGGLDLLDRFGGMLVAVGGMLGGLGAFLLGMRLNRFAPAERLERAMAERRAAVHEAVDAGAFSLGPTAPPPRSYQEAQWQADRLLADEEAQAAKGLLDRHTLYGIPMQWAGLGVGLMLAGVGAALTLG